MVLQNAGKTVNQKLSQSEELVEVKAGRGVNGLCSKKKSPLQ